MSDDTQTHVPSPGSYAAIELGCTCPVLDNNYGHGAYRDGSGEIMYWKSDDCPVHSQTSNGEK